ncbi:polysaccharide lyase family 8 super-sandwich domain-containing protein [Chitinophaga alhagiae]|uniref:polysaccharide lyase family 8 super-sandwich domain-containing protein n=1 Tax=Chitinophaga alhagiae TaxID=2203219 RepID=UPI0018E5940E|nr:polysaccharide lyase family 8 super-sandwich domain-containing protein [Chitinophaga alhagiae]
MKNYLHLVFFLLLCSTATRAQTDFTLVMDRVKADLLAAAPSVTTLNAEVTTNMGNLQANGSWPDISYAYSSTTYTADLHLRRIKNFALAYNQPTGAHYHSAALFTAITSSLGYWDTADPQSWNWYHNQISNPQMLGEVMILLYNTPQLLPAALRSNLLAQMNRGNPAAQTGANKMDVAMHFIYRACLTADSTLMQTGVTQFYMPISQTTQEGIQYDYSYQQHGPQLYVFGYGSVFVGGEVKIAHHLRGTSWALSGTQLSLFSNFVRKGYLLSMRGKYIDFSVNGRSISRVNNLSQAGVNSQLGKLKDLDPAHATEYDQARARIQGAQPPSYMVSPVHSHFWHSDYTVHHRPGYFFGLRNVSPRTSKSENGNGENLKGYYLSEGATNIYVSGSEYYNIQPVWNWSRIPGTTAPYITTFPLRPSWGGNYGTAAFSGGVSDSLYGATALAFNDYSTQARKAWFFFDDEVVCLGAGISATATQPINTTVNQCLLSGAVTVSAGGSQSTVPAGTYSYNNLQWVEHNGVSYYFPAGGNVQLSTTAQSGTWKSINNGGSTTVQTMNVFGLWFDHGTQPAGGSYAYYVIPGQSMAAYDTTAVRILQNNGDMQAVRHTGLNVWQIIFYKAGTFSKDSVTVTVDRACAVMLKQVGSTSVQVSVADPAQSSSPVNMLLTLPNIPQTRQLAASLPSGNFAGSTAAYAVNLSTPVYVPSETTTAITDAYVRNGTAYAGVNYGTAGSLVVKKDNPGYAREVFLKFNVADLPEDANTVKLRLYVNYANTGVAAVPWIAQYVSNDSWTETGINWNNMPITTSNIDTAMGAAAGNYVEWDVTAIALAQQAADGVLTLKIVSNATGSTTDASFAAREAGNTAQRPALVSTAGAPLITKIPGIAESNAKGITVYPNPAAGFIRVETAVPYHRAELRDAGGKVIRVETLNGQQQFRISLERVQSGVYFLQLTGGKGNAVKKIVKL